MAADDVYIYFKQRGSVSQLKRAKELLVWKVVIGLYFSFI